jgi:hypothetical protein
MVTLENDAFAINVLHIINRAARDINGRARINEFESDAFADPATCSGYKGDFFIQSSHIVIHRHAHLPFCADSRLSSPVAQGG